MAALSTFFGNVADIEEDGVAIISFAQEGVQADPIICRLPTQHLQAIGAIFQSNVMLELGAEGAALTLLDARSDSGDITTYFVPSTTVLEELGANPA